MSMSIENLYNLAERPCELLRAERRGMLRAKQLEPVLGDAALSVHLQSFL